MEYLEGFVFRQPWAPFSSSETRLVPYGTSTKTWDSFEYEDQLFYHNSTVRETHQFLNPFTKDLTPIDESQGLTNDYDSICEAFILMDYIRKYSGESYVTLKNVQRLSEMITDKINENKPVPRRFTLADLRKDNMLAKRMYD